MNDNLETKISKTGQYKSAGERKIAEILTKYGIPFKYESPVLVHDEQDKPRIWYPDFFLPEYGIYIEYYGLEGNPDYDNGTARKGRVYAASGIPVLSISGNLQKDITEHYLLSRVYKLLEERVSYFRNRFVTTRQSLWANRTIERAFDSYQHK